MEAFADQGNAIDILKLWDKAEGFRLEPIVPSTILLLLKRAGARHPTVNINKSIQYRIMELRKIVNESRRKNDSKECSSQRIDKRADGNVPGLRKYLELLQKISLDGMKPLKANYISLLSTSCEKGEIDMIKDVLSSMREEGFHPQNWNYGMAMRAYAEAITADTADNILQRCDELVSSMKSDKIEVSEPVYISWTKAYSNSGRILDFDPVLNELRQSGRHPGFFAFSTLLRGYELAVTRENFSEVERRCLDTLAWMEEEEFTPNIRNCNAFIRLCCQGGHLEKGLTFKEKMQKRGIVPNSHTYAIIIHGHSFAVTPYTALQSYNCCLDYMSEARELGLEVSLFHYNALMNVCSKGKLLQKAMDLLIEMEARSIRPSGVTYTSLMDVHAQCITPDTARKIFTDCQELMKKMRKAKLPTTTFVYNALLNACSKGGLVREAAEVYESMLAEQITPDIITFNTLIDVQTQSTTPENVHETLAVCQTILDKIEKSGIEPQNLTYNAILNVCRKGRLAKESMEIFREMRLKNIKCCVKTYTTLLDALAQTTTAETGPQVWKICRDLMKLLGEEKIEPTVFMYTSLLNICSRGELFNEIDTVLDHMLRARVCLNIVCCNIIIKTYAQSIIPGTAAKLWRTCRGLMETMKDEGVFPDEVTYNTLIDAHARLIVPKTAEKSYKQCRALVDEMEKNRLEPGHLTYSALMNVCSKGELLDEAVKVFEELCRKGHQPNVITYSTLIDAYAQSVRPGEAEESYRKCRELMDTMVSKGLTPNGTTYSALLNVCAKGRLLDEVELLLEEMKQNGHAPEASSYNILIDAFTESMKYSWPEDDAVEAFVRRTFADMKRDEVEPTTTTYCSLQKLYGVRGELGKAIGMFDHIKRENLKAHFVCFYVCFKYALLTNNRKYAPKIREKMREFGFGFEDVPVKVKGIMKTLNIRR